MKKVIACMLALCLILALAGCGGTDQTADSGDSSDNTGETLKVSPLASDIDVNAITDADLAASFDAASLHTEGDTMTLDVKVYDFVKYDAAEVAQLKVGDTIVADGQDMVITSIEDGDGYTINGGYDQGGLSLASLEGGLLYAYGADDAKSYYEVGTVTLPLSTGCKLLDSSDPVGDEIKVTTADLAAFLAEDTVTFRPGNTTITVAGGQITGITRVYMP